MPGFFVAADAAFPEPGGWARRGPLGGGGAGVHSCEGVRSGEGGGEMG